VSVSIAATVVAFFFILFVSLDAREEVYMNRVIIPEEKVRITISGSHLLARFL
jgi:hypothetical protein